MNPKLRAETAKKLLELPRQRIDVVLGKHPYMETVPTEVVLLDLRRSKELLGIDGLYEHAMNHRKRGREKGNEYMAYIQLLQTTIGDVDENIVLQEAGDLSRDHSIVPLSVTALEAIANPKAKERQELPAPVMHEGRDGGDLHRNNGKSHMHHASAGAIKPEQFKTEETEEKGEPLCRH